MESIEVIFEQKWLDVKDKYSDDIKALCKEFFEYGINISANNSETNVSFTDFEIWWEMYDKKRGKEKCLKKWAKLTKQEREDCLNATPTYVASTPDKQYRKDPQTYLNGKCWNDEIIINNNNYGRKQIPTDAERINKLGEILAG
jgi:hypothetical protein